MNESAESLLDRLYRLPLDEFTAARNDAVKQARAENPQAADILAKARKPTVAAWAVNQLARSGERAVDQVRETLQAATIGDEARGLLERGRFTKEQQAVGFVALAQQAGSAGRAASASQEAGHSRRRQAAEAKLAAAHERTSKARSELERAVAEAREAKKAVEAAQAALARAKRQETQARSQLDKAD